MTTVLVMLVLGAGVIWYLITTLRAGAGLRPFRDRGVTDTTGQWLLVAEAVIGAFAWAQLARSAGVGAGSGAGQGAFFAVIVIPAVLLASRWGVFRFGVELFLAIIGVLALTPAVAAYVGDTRCAQIESPVLRVGAMVLFALILAGGLVLSTFFARRPTNPFALGTVVLGWYAVVEGALWASEAGTSGLGVIGLITIAVLAMLLPYYPEIILAVLAGLLVVLSLAGMLTDEPTCGERPEGMIGFLLGFGAVAAILGIGRSLLAHRR